MNERKKNVKRRNTNLYVNKLRSLMIKAFQCWNLEIAFIF